MKLAGNTAYWDKRSEIYDQKVLKIYREANRRTIENTIKYMDGTGRALDIGCGTGAITVELAGHAAHMTAADTSPRMLEQAVQKVKQAGLDNVEFLEGDIFQDALKPGSFDIITAFNVLLYMPEQDRAVRRMWELLKPGGYLMAAADCLRLSFTKEALRKWFRSRTGQMPYVRFYSPESFEKLISEQEFRILETEVLFERPANLFVGAEKKV